MGILDNKIITVNTKILLGLDAFFVETSISLEITRTLIKVYKKSQAARAQITRKKALLYKVRKNE